MRGQVYTTGFWSIVLLLFMSIDTMAHTYEWGMYVTSDGTHLIADQVYLYVKNDVNSGMLTPYRSATTSSTPWPGSNQGENFICDIDDNNTANPTWPSIVDGDYYLRIDNEYVELIITPPPGGNAGDFTIVYNQLQHSFALTYNARNIDMGNVQSWTYTPASIILDQKAENG